jgi:uncharacterized protein
MSVEKALVLVLWRGKTGLYAKNACFPIVFTFFKRNHKMKIIKNILIVLFLGPLSISGLLGQKMAKDTSENPKVKLTLIARYYGDSAVLRWGFDAPYAWTEINASGFVVERIELDEKNIPASKEFLEMARLKSWSLEDFKNRMPRTDTLGMVAAQCLYGKPATTGLNNQPIAADDLKTQADMAENRFRMAQFAADLSPRAAESLGWRWVDRNIKPNRKYLYRIFSPIPANFFKIDTTGFILPTKEIFPIVPPQYFNVHEGDRVSTLTWQHTRDYVAYWIEKSTDGTTFFPAVNKPYLAFETADAFEVSYRDSLATNYKPVYYRVSGITPYGDKSDWSKPQIMMGRDLTPPSQPLFTKAEIDRATRKVSLEWQIDEPISGDLQGFYLGYSKRADGVYDRVTTDLLPKTTRQYQTELEKKASSGYYKIFAVDTAGNEAASYFRYVFLYDLDPPSKPVGLTGKIDTNGVVVLNWNQPIEGDVLGYTIQFANASDHVFTPTGGELVEDTTFSQTITLRTLTENIYYRIAAVDMNQNVSSFSEVLTLKKPDKIRPVAPNFKDYLVNDSTIFIAWHPSTSTDAVKQRLYRQLVKNTANGEKTGVYTEGSKMIAEFDNKTDKFTDTPPTTDIYNYTVEAEDDDGLRSIDGDTLTLKLVENKKINNSPKLSAKFDETTKTVSLTWQFDGQTKMRYALYRAISDAPLEQIKMFDGQVTTFADAKIKAGTSYRYAIKALDNEDRESNLSEAVNVLTK